ncbi:hypothetical protein DFQ26_003186, partial [Actinomortierella ambigua]
MVYATRSRVLAQRRGASGGTVSTARGEEKKTPRKRRSSTHLESVTLTKKKAPTTRTRKATIATVTTPSGRKAARAIGVSKAALAALVETNPGFDGRSLSEKDQHHLRFKDYSDSEDASAGGLRHRTRETNEESIGTFVPSVQSNRESRRESSINRHHHTLDNYPSSNNAHGMDDLMSVHRTHLHFHESDGGSQETGGYTHDHTDREYMSGELTKEDDCVPRTLKHSRTMFETFEEGREFVGRDWHFEGEGDGCDQESQVVHKNHKHKHHRHHKGKNIRSHRHLQIRAGTDGGQEYHERGHSSSQPSSSESLPDPPGKWGLRSAFDRLTSFFTANTLSKSGAPSAEESQQSGETDQAHTVEVVDGPNHHIRWSENVSDTESSGPVRRKTPLHSAMKNIYKKRVPGRHVTYQDDVGRAGEDHDHSHGHYHALAEGGTASGVSSRAEAAGPSRWPILRLALALRQRRGNDSVSSSATPDPENDGRSTAITTTAARSSSDRAQTRGATRHLDREVTLLQRLLHEKENALRIAEAARVKDQHLIGSRTETLTREIHDLESSVSDLRSQVALRDQDLAATLRQLADVQKKGRDQLQMLEREIIALNQTNLVKLKDKEAAEKEAAHVKQQLDEATEERGLIMDELRQLLEQQAAKESQLYDLENRVRVESQQAHDLAQSLEASEDELQGLRQQLLQTLEQLNELVAAEAREESTKRQLEAVKKEIRNREGYIRALEKTNENMGRKSNEADKLVDEVKRLKEQLVIHEQELDKARNVIDELVVSRNRAAVLTVQVAALEEQVTRQTAELEIARERKTDLEHAHFQAEELAARVIDLEDQVIVEERHLSYLEDKMLEHENCAAEAQRFADRIEELEEQIDLKEKETRRLKAVEQGATKQEERIASLQSEIQNIQEELQTKTRALKELQSKYGRDTAKLESMVQQLKTETDALKQQLFDKTEQLHRADQVKDQFNRAQQEKKELFDAVEHLHLELERKEALLEKAEESLAQLRQNKDHTQEHLDQAKEQNRELRGQVKHQAKRDQSKVSDDLAKASSSASQLVVQVASLNDQIAQKEEALAKAEKQVAQLGEKQQQIHCLMGRIQDLEVEAANNLTRAHVAEHEANELEERANRVHGLENDIREFSLQLEELENLLDAKEVELTTLKKTARQHEVDQRNIDELRIQVQQLKDLLKDAQSKAKEDIKSKDGEIQALRNEIQRWVEHEAGWIHH